LSKSTLYGYLAAAVHFCVFAIINEEYLTIRTVSMIAILHNKNMVDSNRAYDSGKLLENLVGEDTYTNNLPL
jgi:hypothetical protein